MHLCHLVHFPESAISGHKIFFKVSSKYYTLEGMLAQRLIQQVELKGNLEIYSVLSVLELAQLMDIRMIMQVKLNVQRMNLTLYWFEMNTLCNIVK